MAVIKEEIGYLAEHGMNQEELEAARLKILLRNVQGYEANASFADYYASQYAYFEKNRYFENEEEELEAVTVDDIKRVARDLLSIDKGVVVHETPTLTYTQFYLLIGVVIAIIAVAFLTLNLRFHLVHKRHE
jgi:predicted Zn-dependent peptidase